MADPVTVILAAAATITVVAVREAISWGVSRGKEAQPRDTHIPPAPPNDDLRASFEALRGTVERQGSDISGLISRERQGSEDNAEYRGRVLAKLAVLIDRVNNGPAPVARAPVPQFSSKKGGTDDGGERGSG
jgi:hypothetical protein